LGKLLALVGSHRFAKLRDRRLACYASPLSLSSLQLYSQDCRQILILGSSVAYGYGASAWSEDKHMPLGWVNLLAESLAPQGIAIHNKAIPGSGVSTWEQILLSTEQEAFDCMSVVVIGLSLGNELLHYCSNRAQQKMVSDHFVEGLGRMVSRLRQMMPRGCRLVLGGLYPHNFYSFDHLLVLRELETLISSWPEVDYMIDFLSSDAHDGFGHWNAHACSDCAHPNDYGHEMMFQQVNVSSLLGLPTG